MSSRRESAMLALLGGSALLVAATVHLTYLPRYFPDDHLASAGFLVVGWTAFAIVFYAAARLLANPGTMPSMRTGDVGTALLLLSLLAALALDSFGFGPEVVPGAYALPAIGIYAGLALVGWAIGKRTTWINRIAGEEGDDGAGSSRS